MSEHEHIDEVRKFELALDRALESRPTFVSGGPSALRLAANVCEHIAAEHPGGGGRFVEGLQILAPVLVEGPTREEPDIETLFADLDFAAHYHLLRDYLYYTYNAPGTMLWEVGDRVVKIRFGDPSLPRQFYLAANSWFVDSMSGLGDKARSQRIEELLTGAPEFEETAEAHQAMELIEREVADKLGLYFNFAADVDADLVGYTWSQQLEVYRLLLVKALYHRYHARGQWLARRDLHELGRARRRLGGVKCGALGRSRTFRRSRNELRP